MSVNVLIPTPLRKFTKDLDAVTVSEGTIESLVQDLEGQFPGIAARLCDDAGGLRKFINFYLNEEDIRFLEGKDTKIASGDTVSIVPAIAGG